MGCFDTVAISCPRCGEKQEVQSKGGSCCLTHYDCLDKAPADVLSDINRHAPFTCERCDCIFKVDVKVIAYTKEV